jgi:signal transduction histidine kinase
MRRSLVFWYYFCLVVIVLLSFIFGDFSQITSSLRLIILVFLGLAIFSPLVFLLATPAPPTIFKLAEPVVVPPTSTTPVSILPSKRELELEEINRRLQEADKAKTEFVSLTTHQLRTPLSAIKWTFHMILNGELGPITGDQKHFLQKGYDSAERVITVINEWLNIDYIEAHKDEYKFIPVNISELVDGVVFEFNSALEQKKINLTVNHPKSNIPLIELDPIKMSMVIENLIDNAIKYTPEGGKVAVDIVDDKVATSDKLIELVVSDSGIGIPAAEQAKIFGRFFRSSNAVKASPRGSGLGLSIVKDVAEKHGGKVWFESLENLGTKFHVAIPIKQNKV